MFIVHRYIDGLEAADAVGYRSFAAPRLMRDCNLIPTPRAVGYRSFAAPRLMRDFNLIPTARAVGYRSFAAARLEGGHEGHLMRTFPLEKCTKQKDAAL